MSFHYFESSDLSGFCAICGGNRQQHPIEPHKTQAVPPAEAPRPNSFEHFMESATEVVQMLEKAGIHSLDELSARIAQIKGEPSAVPAAGPDYEEAREYVTNWFGWGYDEHGEVYLHLHGPKIECSPENIALAREKLAWMFADFARQRDLSHSRDLAEAHERSERAIAVSLRSDARAESAERRLSARGKNEILAYLAGIGTGVLVGFFIWLVTR